MYICPTCSREFESKMSIADHFVVCWQREHPYYVSKDAPRSQNIDTTITEDGVMDFFNKLIGV